MSESGTATHTTLCGDNRYGYDEVPEQFRREHAQFDFDLHLAFAQKALQRWGQYRITDSYKGLRSANNEWACFEAHMSWLEGWWVVWGDGRITDASWLRDLRERKAHYEVNHLFAFTPTWESAVSYPAPEELQAAYRQPLIDAYLCNDRSAFAALAREYESRLPTEATEPTGADPVVADGDPIEF